MSEYWRTEEKLFLDSVDYHDDWYDYESYTFIEPKRARRIRDRNRMIAKGRNIDLQHNWHSSWHGKDWHRRERAEMFGRYFYNHLAICSCSICRNPRKGGWTSGSFRLTLQERRAFCDEREQLEALRWQEDPVIKVKNTGTTGK